MFAQAPKAQVQDPSQAAPEKSKAFEDFVNRVKTYMNLRSTLEGSVPKPKSNARDDLLEHEKALTDKIVDARKTPKWETLLRPKLPQNSKGRLPWDCKATKRVKSARRSDRGEPVDLQLHVNQIYRKRCRLRRFRRLCCLNSRPFLMECNIKSSGELLLW